MIPPSGQRTPACIKQGQEATIKADGTATVKLTMGIKTEVIENLRAMIESMGGGDDDQSGEVTGVFDKLTAALDDKKIGEEWKKMGLEITKSSTTEKDGWKTVDLEASIKNVSEYSKKYAEWQKAMQEKVSGGMQNPKEMLNALDKMLLPAIPRFYKTDKANIVKVGVTPRMGNMFDKMDENPLSKLEEMGDEERAMFDAQMNQMRAMFALDEMKVEMKYTLPGKVTAVSGLKQDGNTVTFSMLGKNIGIDTIKDVATMGKNGMTATVQIDEKDWKIALEDEPKATESKPVEKTAKPAKKTEEEEKKKEKDG